MSNPRPTFAELAAARAAVAAHRAAHSPTRASTTTEQTLELYRLERVADEIARRMRAPR